MPKIERYERWHRKSDGKIIVAAVEVSPSIPGELCETVPVSHALFVEMATELGFRIVKTAGS